MLYQITDGSLSFGGRSVLSHIHFEIKSTEKIAIVGKNGAGKTTLLRLILGELDLDRDDKRQGEGIFSSRKLTIKMLRQSDTADQEQTVEEHLLENCPAGDLFSRDRYAYETEYDRLFTGFGFEKKDKLRLIREFSGGEQTKIRLIRLLLQKPDILLLDEPTNHLDMETVEWLEQYMKTYDRAVIFVSHDRFFLDQVTEVVYEVHNAKLTRYSGNYTSYREQKVRQLAIQKKTYERQQEEIDRLNGLINRFKNKPKKAAFARSRKKILERMDVVEKTEEDDVHVFSTPIEPATPGRKWMYEAEHLKIGYDSVLAELSLRVKRGQKIGIIGPNGAGKSTFLKTAAGLLEPVDGKSILSYGTVIGYFDQHTAQIDSEKQVVQHFHDLFPSLTEKEVRQTLGAYLFGGKAAGVFVKDLSGGEKSRLILAELIQSRPNLFLLDEPTNHMDIQAKETLESAFRAYTGTMLFVSHDRYFIDQVADAILVFEQDRVLYYPFGYSHYVEQKKKNLQGNITALVQAEDAALLAGMQAVPKAERHRLREMDTEEAYADWQFGLAKEQITLAKRKVEHYAMLSEAEALSEEYWKHTYEKELEQAWEDWTEACMAWYEVWAEQAGDSVGEE